MRLRTQLIILSLLTLSLPWAGCEYIREMENTLRDGQAQNLLITTKTIAHVLSYENREIFQYDELTGNDNHTDNNVYAFSLDSKILLDGYADDWGALWDQFRYFPNQLDKGDKSTDRCGFIAAGNASYIYLFVKVNDDHVIYHDPARGLVNGDGLQLLLQQKNGEARRYILQTGAPGKITAFYVRNADSLNPSARREPRIHGQWQDTAEGFNVEIRIPRKLISGHINFARVDTDTDAEKITGWYGTWNRDKNINNGLIIEHSDKLKRLVEKFKQDNARLRITDRQGWLLASLGSPHKPNDDQQPLKPDSALMAALNQLYHFIMYFSERSQPAIQFEHGLLNGEIMIRAIDRNGGTAWYKPQRSNRAIVTAAFPVIIDEQVAGVVVADQSSDAILTLTNYALNRLITLSSIAMLMSALGLLGYATYLSVRIRRLRNATENIISADGEISDDFRASSTRDELGDLSRSFADMHKRLKEYTQYLRSLASKLSHELRTPLAVVQSSLDNLASHDYPEDVQVYTRRAREGSERLSRIITALSEASRVEQSIQSADAEIFNLVPVIGSSIDAYRDVYPDRHFVKQVCEDDCLIKGTPELMVQMLDKLVDNAADFSPDNGNITMRLEKHRDHLELGVHNVGPALPEHMQSQLFDSMVSIRRGATDKPHMGLGLYIVKLIAEAHGGQVKAMNSANGSGVEFIVRLPLIRN